MDGIADCTKPASIDALGLVVAGRYNYDLDISVNGSVYMNVQSGGITKVKQTALGCVIRQAAGTGDFKLSEAKREAIALNFNMATTAPTLIQSIDGTFQRVGDSLQQTEYVTYNSCYLYNKDLCKDHWPNQMSDSTRALQGGTGTYSGPIGLILPTNGQTYILNVRCI